MASASKHNPGSDEQLRRCWAQQYCRECLDQVRCSWCPFTQTCIPNNYAIQPLAPAYDEDICPHWAERWDIRTKPLGCQVSTITSLTCIISVLSTLAFLLLCYLAIRAVQAHKRHPSWWKVWAYDWPARTDPKTRNTSASNGDSDWDARQRQPLLGNPSPIVHHPHHHHEDLGAPGDHQSDGSRIDSDQGDSDSDGDSGSDCDSDSS